jgi:hypothetical protein
LTEQEIASPLLVRCDIRTPLPRIGSGSYEIFDLYVGALFMTKGSFEPGSFRDRTSRIFYHNGAVYRALAQQALQDWQFLASTRFFQRLCTEGELIPSEQVEGVFPPSSEHWWAAVLKHQTVPFISYPYEWSFSMLQDAALLQLKLLLAALDEGMTLKDATPFNFQWIGTHLLFIDTPSFERLTPGEPWIGYRQFCQLFLYPLFLQAYKDVSFQPWLRGALDGVEPEECYGLLSLRDLFRPGVFTHVYLQAKVQAKFATTTRDVKKELHQAGFHPTLIKANVRRLYKIIRKLAWKRTTSTWAKYTEHNSYTDEDEQQKKAFVRRVVKSRPWKLVWDLGCNTGTFSHIAAENAATVVAMDADQLVVERLYQRLKAQKQTIILPLVNNVVDPSPSLGWRGLERKALLDRGKPELTLCLALLHHLIITANIPLKEFVDWMASVTQSLIIEFVTREDPMVRVLLRNKQDTYTDYDQDYFEQCLGEAFAIVQQESLASGTRILYHGQARRPANG